MTIRKAIGEGIRQTNRSLSAVMILFGINFILAGLAALLFRSTVNSAFGSSLAPEKLVQDFDYTVYIDFMIKNPEKLSLVFGFIIWLVVLSNLISAFFDGGVIAAVSANAGRFNLKSFFASCGEFLGRFLRLFFIIVLILFISVIVLALLAGFIYSLVIGDGENEIQILRAAVAAVATFILPLSVFIIATDYARVITVTRNEHRMFRAFWHGLRFVFRQFLGTYGLSLLCLIPVLFLLICWAGVSTQITADSGLLVFGIFLLQQIIVLGRVWVRVMAIGSQVSFYAGSQPVTIQEPSLEPVAQAVLQQEAEPVPVLVSTEEEKYKGEARKKKRPRVMPKRVRVKRAKKVVRRSTRRTKKQK